MPLFKALSQFPRIQPGDDPWSALNISQKQAIKFSKLSKI